jgi:hypothetical protein
MISLQAVAPASSIDSTTQTDPYPSISTLRYKTFGTQTENILLSFGTQTPEPPKCIMRHTKTQTTRPATVQASFTQTFAPEKIECGTQMELMGNPSSCNSSQITTPDLCMEQDEDSVEDIDDDDSDDADFELPQSTRRKRATCVTSDADVLPEDDQTYLIFGAQLMELFRSVYSLILLNHFYLCFSVGADSVHYVVIKSQKSISPTLNLEVSSK